MTPEVAREMSPATLWSCARIAYNRMASSRRAVRWAEEYLAETRELADVFERRYQEFLEAAAQSGAHPYLERLWRSRGPRQLTFDFRGESRDR